MATDITVVVPTYNGAAYITSALESVFAQTRLPAEIVVVDDCSTDATVEVVSALASQSPVPLRVDQLPKNSGGPTVPMNTGVRQARTPYVVTLDQDDPMAPARLAVQAGVLDAHPEVPAVIGLLAKMDGAGHPIPDDFVGRSRARILGITHQAATDCYLLDPAGFYAHVLFEGTLTIASSTAFRTATWAAVGGFAAHFRVAWDLDLSCKLPRLGPVAFVNQVIGHYRLHATNTSTQGLTCEREVLAIRAANLHSPALPFDDEALRRGLVTSYLGLGYQESVRGDWSHMIQAYRAAQAHGHPTGATLAGLAKGMVRAAWAGLTRGRTKRRTAG